jgi:phage terminase small subunit
MRLTQKQEQFALYLFQDMPQREAYVKAGYSATMLPATIDQNASRLARNSKVLARIKELRQKAETKAIMSVQERMERLSEIAKPRLTDFIELGKDGSWVNIGKETPNSGAIQEIHSRTEYDENGEHPTIYTSVKLHDPVKAIDLLNKMDRIYDDNPKVNVNLDQRSIVIQVVSDNAKQLTERIFSGEGTEKPNGTSNNFNLREDSSSLDR